MLHVAQLRSETDLSAITRQCRSDFENGLVSDEQLVALYEKYLPSHLAGLPAALHTLRSGFPYGNCEFGAVYLRDRVGYGTIVDGNYILPDGYREPHTYLLVGRTALAERTISDITADQFYGPPVYIGALTHPYHAAPSLNL